MYCVNQTTGETIFRTHQPGARSVVVIATSEKAPARRLPMQSQSRSGRWEIRVNLPVGWLFYAFEVDGRLRWDRDAGKLRTSSGQPCSLALITTAQPLPANSHAC